MRVDDQLLSCYIIRGGHMKKWHVEGILYLNDFGKRKLAMPDVHQFSLYTPSPHVPKKDSFLLNSLKRIAALMVKSL